jgi:hypothetical protein
MAKIKKFEDFWVKLTESELTRMDEAPGDQLAMEFPTDAPATKEPEKHEEPKGFKATFESPLYVTEQWASFWEKLMQYGTPKEFMEKARELGNEGDFQTYYEEWKNSEENDEEDGDEEKGDRDQKFWDNVWDDVKNSDRPVRLIDSGVSDEDVEDDIVSSFNEDNLAQYAKEKVPTLTSLKAIGVKNGMFEVEATYSEEPTEEVLKATKEYLAGQYSDGWGEGYEQQDQKGGDSSPDFCVHAYAPHKAIDRDSWHIKYTKK